jgi:hypothetical protein
MKLVPYLAFNTLLNTLDVARYPRNCYLKISGAKGLCSCLFSVDCCQSMLFAYRETIFVDLMEC